MYDARQIANWFINKSSGALDTLTLSQLFRLIYISHERYIEKFGRPLVRNRIEAWWHGPVIPDVYEAFRDQGAYVDIEDPHYESGVNRADDQLLNDVYAEFGHMSVPKLASVTNRRNSPWGLALAHGAFTPITFGIIAAFKRTAFAGRPRHLID